ncbi:hypothetical protein NQZ68_014806 [Dissostichus eleginoides]|nr:hypothetical protein NQZ68_014806 [Dissostichus eleginoides]
MLQVTDLVVTQSLGESVKSSLHQSQRADTDYSDSSCGALPATTLKDEGPCGRAGTVQWKPAPGPSTELRSKATAPALSSMLGLRNSRHDDEQKSFSSCVLEQPPNQPQTLQCPGRGKKSRFSSSPVWFAAVRAPGTSGGKVGIRVPRPHLCNFTDTETGNMNRLKTETEARLLDQTRRVNSSQSAGISAFNASSVIITKTPVSAGK